MTVRADVFPARIAIASPNSIEDESLFTALSPLTAGIRKLDRCRVVVFQDKIHIAVDSPEGPKLVFKEAITAFIREGKTFRVVTETGKIIAFQKDKNCGCGSRLRSWTPYGTSLEA
jgi:hypothetical protein